MITQAYSLLDLRLTEITGLSGLSFVGDDIMINGLNLSNREILSSSVLSYCTSLKYVRNAFSNPKFKAILISASLYDVLSDAVWQYLSFIID